MATSQGYVRLYCIESPQVWFDDSFKVPLTGELTAVPIDPLFVETCEPDSILVIGLTLNKPAIPSGEVLNTVLYLHTIGRASIATVTLRGIRKGFPDVRFTPATEAEFRRNQDFWSQTQ